MEKKPGEMKLVHGSDQIQNKKTRPAIRQARVLNVKVSFLWVRSQS